MYKDVIWGAVSLVLNTAEWKSMFRLIHDLHHTMEQSQMAMHDPDTPQIIPELTAGLVDKVKGTAKFVYLEKEYCLTPHINAEWYISDEVADILCMQAMLDRLYDDQILICEICPFSMV